MCSGLTVCASHLYAAEPPKKKAEKAEHITVLKQRQPYLGRVAIKDVPQNIITVSGKTLQEAGITTLANALDLVSGIARQNSFGGMWDSFAVRGFAGDINVPSGFLVNGFNYGRGFGGPRDMSGVERIDVLKGPSSALFGRGEPGGTVDIITKKPQFEQHGSFGLQGGSYHDIRVDGDYTAPLTQSLAMRLNGAFEDSDSFRKTVHTRKWTIAPSLLWKITDKTSLSYQLSYTRQDIPFDRGIVAVNGRLGVIPVTRFLGEPGDGPNKVGDLGHQLQLQHDFNHNWGLQLGFGDRLTDMEGFGETPELATARQPLFRDGRTLSRQRRYIDYQTEDLVGRAELSGEFKTWSLKHHVLIGTDYDAFDFDSVQKRYRPPALSSNPSQAALNAIDIFAPVYRAANALPATNAVVFNQKEKSRTAGGYVQDQIDVTKKIKIRLGGRFDDYQQKINFRTNNSSSSQHQTAFSPQVGAVYEPVRSLSLYVSYGRGFRPNSGTDYAGTPFRPERTRDVEIGAKYSSLDRRIEISMDAFRMTKDNILTSDPARVGYSLAIGKAVSQGVETDIHAALPYGFRTIASASYIDAHSTSTVLDPDFGRVVAKGDPLINIPAWSANVLLFRDFHVAGHQAMLGAGVNYVGRRLGETGTNFYLPSYTLVRLIGSFNVTKRLVLSGQIDNLTNKTWYANSYAALWVYPGAPRTFSLRARYEF
ncbi:TonB-dependent siderophore receptor [Neokomagataea thailandica NBRC 106555]|uniref:TonB-dependent siderophore receptor n=1 Tax=Neokomagataea thailandica NBRC 106555 TaxID=1223520 RepID=A0ABQ0QP29_9PROT|nr:TonB-dependent siderophore receptor [Neokomagataea thailandica NBRC 106555]